VLEQCDDVRDEAKKALGVKIEDLGSAATNVGTWTRGR